MERVGIVICNYNKADDVCACIQSVLELKYEDYRLQRTILSKKYANSLARVRSCSSMRKILAAREASTRVSAERLQQGMNMCGA